MKNAEKSGEHYFSLSESSVNCVSFSELQMVKRLE